MGEECILRLSLAFCASTANVVGASKLTALLVVASPLPRSDFSLVESLTTLCLTAPPRPQSHCASFPFAYLLCALAAILSWNPSAMGFGRRSHSRPRCSSFPPESNCLSRPQRSRDLPLDPRTKQPNPLLRGGPPLKQTLLYPSTTNNSRANGSLTPQSLIPN